MPIAPRNAAIYGDGADDGLIGSITLFGVLDPLLITPEGVVLSGHRRLDAAVCAGLEEVEVIVRPVADDLEALLARDAGRPAVQPLGGRL
jgi:ParB family transcriptional regulator, chromosome partitioning protein